LPSLNVLTALSSMLGKTANVKAVIK